jgi:hypothetical protein
MTDTHTASTRRPFKAVVQRLSDGAFVAREFDKIRDAVSALEGALRDVDWDVPTHVLSLNLMAGTSHIVSGYEYRIMDAYSNAWDQFPETSAA